MPTANAMPGGITNGPDGNIWFTEYATRKIARITTAGTVTEFLLPGGTTGAPFNDSVPVPYLNTLGPDGNVWFTVRATSRIKRRSSSLWPAGFRNIGARVNSSAPLAVAALPCTANAGSNSNSLGAVTLPGLGSIAALTTNAEGTTNPSTGTQTGISTSTVGPISLLGGLITASKVETTATATGTPITSSGSVTFTNLRILGVPYSVNVEPNTGITLPLIGSVVLNEQVMTSNGIAVNALRVKLLGATDLIVAHAAAHIVNPSAACPVP